MNRFEGGPRPAAEKPPIMDKALRNEKLTPQEVRTMFSRPGAGEWPTAEQLRDYMCSLPDREIKGLEEHRQEITEHGGNPDAAIAEMAELRKFEGFEINDLEQTEYYPFIAKFMEGQGISPKGVKIIAIDNPEYWKKMFGSNITKSSMESKAITIDKSRFKDLDKRQDLQSWLVHEVAHTAFYDRLGAKLPAYVKQYEKDNRYTDSANESVAYQTQFEFLKKTGWSKEQAVGFMEEYLDEAYGSADEATEEVKKELKTLTGFIDAVYAQK